MLGEGVAEQQRTAVDLQMTVHQALPVLCGHSHDLLGSEGALVEV